MCRKGATPWTAANLPVNDEEYGIWMEGPCSKHRRDEDLPALESFGKPWKALYCKTPVVIVCMLDDEMMGA